MTATVRGFWEAQVAAAPGAPFLVYEDTTLSYGEFDASVNRLAHGLYDDGVRAGDKVALLLPSDLLILRLELALQKLGAVMVPMIESLTHPEIMYVLGHCRPGRLITDARGWATIAGGGGVTTDHPLQVHVAGGAPDGTRDVAALETDRVDAPPAPSTGALDPMAIMYTSGSTGRPKGVVQPNAGFAAAGHAIAARLGVGPQDNLLAALPLFHTAATHMILAPAIAAGARFTLVPRFSRDRFWDQARASGATISLLMPAQLSILMTAPPREDDRDHDVRVIFSHIRPDAFCERFGVDVCTTWAMTEISGMGTLSAPGHAGYAPKFIGHAMPDDAEVKVVDPAGAPVAPGELGELCFRHPHVMTEYFQDAGNTADTLRDGWVHSGDLCALDESGGVYFHGRLKHVIKRAGENIAGEEVEFTIMDHPAVEECIVCGVEDPIYTEEVHASVVVRAGHELTEQDIVRWCGERLSPWKVPRYVALQHADLPKLANGKTDRRTIKAGLRPERAWDRTRADREAVS
jgi:crotonobetaine/carnitine-CoA ligase